MRNRETEQQQQNNKKNKSRRIEIQNRHNNLTYWTNKQNKQKEWKKTIVKQDGMEET